MAWHKAWSKAWTGWCAVGQCAMAVSIAASGATAQEHFGPVVVELYTSQGCAACPPADEMMHRLAERPDVIALALHVDYWDYIGWKDSFAHPEHAERQRGFAARVGKSMVYTPQMVIDGVAQVVGNQPMEVADIVMTHADTADAVAVTVERDSDAVVIRADGTLSAPAEVHLVRFVPEKSVDITRGENRGKTISYANIVQAWDIVAQWDGAMPLELRIPAEGEASLAVLVQEPDHGPILGAAALP